MLRWTSRAPKAKTPLLAPSGAALGVGGQTQSRTLRNALFPREFFKGVGVLEKGMGVLELNGAAGAREFHRRADLPCGATARGVGHANASSFTR
jgi:hypothetical protein